MEESLLPQEPHQSNVPYSKASCDDGEQEHINIVMDDMQESSTSSTVFTGGNKAASGTPGEQDEAFTISFEYDTTFRAHKVAPVASSFDQFLRKLYHYSLWGTYNVVVFFVGIILVVFWGVLNAFTIFSQTWCLSPIVRYYLVSMQCAVYPCYEISKHMFKCTNDLCRILGAGCSCCRRKSS